MDIVLNRSDLPLAIPALESVGFLFRQSAGVTMFLDGKEAKARDAVQVVFAGEKVRQEYVEVVPGVDEFEYVKNVRTMKLESLVRMKLTSHRRKDQVHVLDMISVGLIDSSWLNRFSAPLAERLKELIDSPDG